MRRRAEQVDQTRRRITEAAVHLHTTIGPARTTISALAEEAGVTRLTVYRHFPDEEELFTACRGHWIAEHLPPDPARWGAIPDLGERARCAFAELYAWYDEHGDALFPIYRDQAAIPGSVQEAMRAEDAALADALLYEVDASPRLRAAAGHLTRFWTWRSLRLEERLDTDGAIDLAVRLLLAAV